jgi:hypothetical protein
MLPEQPTEIKSLIDLIIEFKGIFYQAANKGIACVKGLLDVCN